MPKEILFRGVVTGEAVTDLQDKRFVIKLDEQIPEAPEEIVVYMFGDISGNPQNVKAAIVRKGDGVRVQGKLIYKYLKFWDADIFKFKATKLYNESLKIGF